MYNQPTNQPTNQPIKELLQLYWLILILLVPLLSCNKDSGLQYPVKDNSSLEIRNNDFTVQNGIVVFNDMEAFKRTMDSLSSGSSTFRANFNANISITTVAKAFNTIEQYDYENPDTDYPTSLLTQLAPYIKINYDSEGLRYLTPITSSFNEFLNADHVFMIGSDMVKVTNASTIYIKNALLKNWQGMNESTTTDTTNGIIVTPISFPPTICCPENDGTTVQYSYDGTRRKIEISMNTYYFPASIPGIGSQWQVTTRSVITNYRKRWFGWKLDRVHSLNKWQLHGVIDFPLASSVPVSLNIAEDLANNAISSLVYHVNGPFFKGYPDFFFPDVCYDSNYRYRKVYSHNNQEAYIVCPE
ncbi:MAG: hypothetical protein J5I59_10740 [Saprospiraceae bacterium]|nr:hypothetical protein [Saprospiraceae bacterium]